MPADTQLIAFEGMQRFAAGPLPDVARAVWQLAQLRPQARIVVFDQASSAVLEVETHATADQAVQRLRAAVRGHHAARATDAVAPVLPTQPGPGRPRLGVVAREVTLLPRHWDWLNKQPGGASVALRKLVELARRSNEPADTVRHAQEVSYRFMSAMAGDLPGFEEAARALFAADRARFVALVAPWPTDLRDHLLVLATPAFTAPHPPDTSYV